MIPHHLPLGQQHHLQQQQQQQADGPHLGMNSAFERQQMWIQQQHQQQMLMRNQQQGGPDMASAPMQQQMADLLRSQGMNRMQNQQQFGLGMGHPGLNHNQPSTSFLDQSNQGNPQNRMSPLGFANNMGPGGAPGQNSSNFNGAMNRNMMLQALQNNQSHNRQLELMGLAQNQQNQNSPLNLPNRLGPGGMPPHQAPGGGFNGPPGMNQGAPQQGDLFPNGGPGSNEAMRRPSPSHLPQQHQPQPPVGPSGRPIGPSPSGQMGMPNGPRRIITLSDLQERSQIMSQNIQNIEFQMRNLASARATMTDQLFTQKMRTFQLEITQRKEGLTKINQLMNQMTTSGKTTMTLPLPQGASGPSWMANQSIPGNSLQPPPFGGNGNMSGPIGQPPLQSNGQSSPSPAHASPSGLRSGPPANAPPFPNQVSPNMNFPQANSQGSPPASGANGLGSNANGGPLVNSVSQGLPFNLLGPVPPLSKERFAGSYKNFCTQKNITHEQRLLSIDNLTIDLYALHVEVMKEGGVNLVQQKDLWPIIAGRLGCVQFPGEPPKSGPAAANQLAHVYREYLMEFDRIYMASFVDQRRKNMQLAQQMAQNPIFTKFTAHQIKTLVEFSNKSVQEMRMVNMPEELIRAVEGHRQNLQVLAREQNLFRTMLTMKSGQQGNGGMPMIPPDGGMSVKPPFSGSPQPSNISGVMPPGPPFMPGNTAPLGPHSTPSQPGLQQALHDVHAIKQDYLQRCIPSLQTVDVPAEQRLEYNSLLEQVHSKAANMDQKLSYLHLVGKNEQQTRVVISKVINVQQQRTMIGYSNPRFIMTLDELRNANQVIQTALDFVSNAFKPQHGGIPPNSAPLSTQARQLPNTTAHQHPSPQAHQSGQLANPALNRSVNLQQLPPPIKRAPSKGSASSPKDISTSTPPPANASTPNAPTPTHNVGSPQTPKSPKTKAPAKPRQQQQKRRLSSVSKHPSTPTTEPAQIPAPTNGVKRPREEEEPSPPNVGSSSTAAAPGPSGATNEPSPPKRVKTDWEGPISDELKKKTEAVENIKTEEEASSFFEQMLSSVSNSEDGTANGLPAEFCQTLDAIFKGVGAIPDSECSGDMSSILGGDIIGRSSPSPLKDEFVEFFDFSSFGAAQEGDESDSKADTPDLIPSSSTNPSPESNHESDPTLHALNDIKSEEPSDPLRLGTLKEIDGGESAYYQSHEWKWDTFMATLDQPWAISNT